MEKIIRLEDIRKPSLTVSQVSAITGFSTGEIYRAITDGRIPCIKLGISKRGGIRIHRDTVEKIMNGTLGKIQDTQRKAV